MVFKKTRLQRFWSQQNGFSLIGVLVSFFIVTIGMVSVLSLVNISFKGFAVSQDRLTASYLAQEGIEIVRYIRRANEDGDVRWSNWYNNFTTTSRNYRVQYDRDQLLSYSDTPLRINNSGFYQYNSGTKTKFYRKITIKKINSNQLQLLVDIKWKNRGGNWSHLIAENRLWDWR